MKLYISLAAKQIKLEQDAIDAFTAIADYQRGAPEAAMLKVQHTVGGGVLGTVVEHAGDLIHRMTMHAKYKNPDAGYEYMVEKVNKVLSFLTNDYGFIREHEENLEHNAAYNKISTEHLTERVKQALRVYARTFFDTNLPVYNRAQYLARQVPLNIGLMYLTDKPSVHSAIVNLYELKALLDKGESAWNEYAFHVDRDKNGKLLTYSPK